MVKLQPVLKNYLWGSRKRHDLYGRENGDKISESWEVSVHPDGVSEPLAKYLAENPTAVDEKGSSFPVLIKYIDAMQNLSLQVHPNDEYTPVKILTATLENDAGIYGAAKLAIEKRI